MILEIITPEKNIFNGTVDSVILPGKNGSFQLLRDHAPMVSTLKKGDLVYEIDGKKETSMDDLDVVVFVIDKEGIVKKVKVKTAIQDINNIEITEGIKEGDLVVSGPYEVVSKKLKAKDKVKVVDKKELFEKKEQRF